jgi:hypothetical protein
MGTPMYIKSYVSEHATGPIEARDERGNLVEPGLMRMSRAGRENDPQDPPTTKQEADREPDRRPPETD